MVSLSLPGGLALQAVDRLYRGISQQAQRFRCVIAGGDLSATRGPITLTAALFGTIPHGRRPLRRRGARAGWKIAVTGTLGSAAAGLKLLESGRRATSAAERRWVRAQLDPTPRLEAARVLQDEGVGVAGDISDGLYREVEKIAEPAGLGADLVTEALPVDRALAKTYGEGAWRLALRDSEDFELVCAAPGARLQRAATAVRQATGLRLTVVGTLSSRPGIRLWRNGRTLTLKNAGFQHFR